MPFLLRQATSADIPRLREIVHASVRTLQAADYTPAQIAGALHSVYGVDTQLIADGTYFAVELVGARHAVPAVNRATARFILRTGSAGSKGPSMPANKPPAIVACGGWSKRKTLYGGDQFALREDSLLDPARDAAKIRAFFVHPHYVRRGIATLLLDACEQAARAAGFTRLEMGSTLTGVAFYRAQGYAALENLQVPLSNGEMLPIVKMSKEFKREF
jgi:GNAT superfamily N-acetyltransferase